MADGEGLRVGSPARLRATLTSGDRVIDLTGRSVSVSARFVGSVTNFTPSTEIHDTEAGEVDILLTGAQLDQAADLAFEFTVTGDPIVNPNSKPLVVPVRSLFAEAS